MKSLPDDEKATLESISPGSRSEAANDKGNVASTNFASPPYIEAAADASNSNKYELPHNIGTESKAEGFAAPSELKVASTCRGDNLSLFCASKVLVQHNGVAEQDLYDSRQKQHTDQCKEVPKQATSTSSASLNHMPTNIPLPGVLKNTKEKSVGCSEVITCIKVNELMKRIRKPLETRPMLPKETHVQNDQLNAGPNETVITVFSLTFYYVLFFLCFLKFTIPILCSLRVYLLCSARR